jgi:hypothetical protein
MYARTLETFDGLIGRGLGCGHTAYVGDVYWVDTETCDHSKCLECEEKFWLVV